MVLKVVNKRLKTEYPGSMEADKSKGAKWQHANW